MASTQKSQNKPNQSRDIDNSLYLMGAALAGLVLFLVVLIGSMSAQKSNNKTKQTYRSIQIDESGGSDIGYRN